jgi:hypothetical protein
VSETLSNVIEFKRSAMAPDDALAEVVVRSEPLVHEQIVREAVAVGVRRRARRIGEVLHLRHAERALRGDLDQVRAEVTDRRHEVAEAGVLWAAAGRP